MASNTSAFGRYKTFTQSSLAELTDLSLESQSQKYPGVVLAQPQYLRLDSLPPRVLSMYLEFVTGTTQKSCRAVPR
ncbi:hypothetical protein TNCV_362521 [Trichonephila clavipes]|nr:hypothetical protein TNCV_362521 [Trichonephila clavipes]